MSHDSAGVSAAGRRVDDRYAAHRGQLPVDAVEAWDPFATLVRVQTAWFATAAFPSFLLVDDAHSCVAFQGTAPWADFVAIQALFVLSFLPLFVPQIVRRPGFLRYQQLATTLNLLVQLGAATVHAHGLFSDGRGLQTACFRVDFGGLWYLLVVNVGGVGLFVAQLVVLSKIARRRSAHRPPSRRDGAGRRRGEELRT